MKLKTIFPFLVAVFLSACMSSVELKTAVEIVPMPEPLFGINVFVANDLLAIPAEGVQAQKQPNPYRPLAFDDKATIDSQQLAASFSGALRESIQPIFRTRVAQTFCFVAGATYPWSELRRDQRNYYLVIWPTRASVQSQSVDVRAILVHEASGRQVWQYTFKDPYRAESVMPGGLSYAERVSIAQGMSEKLLAELSSKGFLTGVPFSGGSSAL